MLVNDWMDSVRLMFMSVRAAIIDHFDPLLCQPFFLDSQNELIRVVDLEVIVPIPHQYAHVLLLHHLYLGHLKKRDDLFGFLGILILGFVPLQSSLVWVADKVVLLDGIRQESDPVYHSSVDPEFRLGLLFLWLLLNQLLLRKYQALSNLIMLTYLNRCLPRIILQTIIHFVVNKNIDKLQQIHFDCMVKSCPFLGYLINIYPFPLDQDLEYLNVFLFDRKLEGVPPITCDQVEIYPFAHQEQENTLVIVEYRVVNQSPP